QASGWLIIGLSNFSSMPLLAAFKEAKLRSFVTPNTRLIVNGPRKHEGSGFSVTQAEVRRDDRLICNAEITFRQVPFPNPEFLANLKQVAHGIGFGWQCPPRRAAHHA